MYDVLIIGAGVTGAMIARTLSAYKLSICIAEKECDVAMGASKANSAIVHAGFDAKGGSLKAKLNVEGSKMMPQVTRDLGVKYQNNGSLVIGFNADDRRHLEELMQRGIANGVEGLKVIDADELHEIEPNLSANVVCALYAPTGAIICPYELTVAAIGNAMDNGADLALDFEVTDIQKNANSYKVFSHDRVIESRFVVNAAGINADAIASMIGDISFDIHPRRGEYMLLDKECGTLCTHTIFRTPTKLGKGILVSPTVDGNLLAGPTSIDITDKDDKSTTPEGFAKIIAEAGENLVSFPAGKVITSFCGLRAVGSTGDFIIDSPADRFVNVAGIESPGLSASPAIAQYVAELLQKLGLSLEANSDFNPTRPAMHAFKEASVDEKNAIIKNDPSYGKIICRCEGVTEGEILAAIRNNPKARDLDGVKRRTRAQMGRCQGGFCSPYIVELIAREMNIDYTSVTKNGKGSYINIGKTKEAQQ